MLFLRTITRASKHAAVLFFLLAASVLHAADSAAIRGTVTDPLGAVVAGARIELLGGHVIIATAQTDSNGHYSFNAPAGERYTVRVTAPTFESTVSNSFFATSGSGATVDVVMATKTLTQEVTVTATGRPTPTAQVGASVTVLTQPDYKYQPEVQDPLRLVPGVQVTQTGQMGGTSGLSIRGGNTNANKVLIDGVPANDIGGAVEFANIDSVGIDRIEVLREPNSALYGSDALAGVINLTTARGTTPLPLFTYAADGGNFTTYRQEGSIGGTYRNFDYYSAYGRMNTQNSIPDAGFHNGTYAGNFGWDPNARNDFRFTTRHLNEASSQPNAYLLYGIPDSAGVQENDTYYSASWDNHATDRWHNQIRYGGLRLHYLYNDYAATGIYDPDLDVYLGAPVTITGANGYTVSGQAIFQYGASYGSSYPNFYVAPSKRDFVYAQTDYQVNPHLVALGAFKYEDERGTTQDSGLPATSIERGNYSYTIQLAGDFWNRLYYTLGSGLEDNGLFGFAATPRASLAYYLARPSGNHLLSGTKLHFSFGKGIKEPSIYYQSISLYDMLAAEPGGQQLIAQYGVQPIGPETSRTYDGGVEQQLWNGRARINLSYFHNEFTNGVEFVPQAALIAMGIPGGSDPAAQFGAAVNSQAFRTLGFETEIEYRLNSHLFARGGYTYTDSVVQRSFSSETAPTENPDFPGIAIGAFSPLIGARQFRVAPHTGYFALNYAQSKWNASLSGTLVGRRDDSDFLTDAEFGNTLLLPNRNLDGAYQRLDLNGDYALTHHITMYANLQNLLSEHYSESFGYPALPLTLRAGMRFTFGGESWSRK
ncbi:TonB-dependent receptor [Silvibacterium acidisoli]|uniref:TonB-dependent receptor n=1 Tax=Acidobacteriaceae bacterium ZG23-2 TaxID=2883246 RepID=UPI00406BE25F